MEHQADNKSIDLISLTKPYIAKWYWFILSTLIFFIIGLIYIKLSVPVYSIKSAVLIKDAKKSLNVGEGNLGVLEGLSGFGGMSTNSIENELEIFKSKKLIRDIVISKNLQTQVFVESGFKKIELFGDTCPVNIVIVNEKKNKKFPEKPFEISKDKNNWLLESEEFGYNQKIVFNKLISLPFANIIITPNQYFDKEKLGLNIDELQVNFNTTESATSQIQNSVEIDLANKDATVIDIFINSAQTDKAKTIIEALIAAYNRDAILDKNTESQKTKEFIDERISKISTELDNVETEKEDFKTINGITDIFTETKINLETAAETKKKELELNGQLELTDDLISYLQKQNNFQALPSNIGLNNNDSNNAIANYNKMILERNRLLETATPQNPLVIDITKQINVLRKAVEETLQKGKVGLQLALGEYLNEQDKLKSRIIQVPKQEKLFRNLERKQQIKENLYLLLLQKREEVAISLAVVAPKARLVEPVFISDKPISPKKIVILLASLLIGLLVPFGAIYLKELLNTKIVDKDNLKELSTIPVIGEIPSIKKNVEHLIKHNDFSPLAESFRILITNMNFMLDANKKSKVVFVTSSIKGEGKTFVSMNLALTLTTSNNVIIIGADIRNPQLQRYSENSKSKKGLTEFLYDQSCSIEDVLFKNPVDERCDIIYSGSIPPNPTELLKNGRFSLLLEKLREKYEYIIVDTAPLLLVTDTLIITKNADLNLYVTRSNYTERSLIEFANDTVGAKKIDNVAFVLNDLNNQNFGYGNKYGYGYNK
ncbi:GumC family protein [Epilithonimonas hungarica]|uniref:GumC family protein n=1 Tax=Epilithonimonas hungarica TaxID=454006 RepID=UPI0027D89A57|nr:polysaccharide biosynthesis tyrosine autokinase [Epilithonimonas hungarica]